MLPILHQWKNEQEIKHKERKRQAENRIQEMRFYR